MSLDYAYKLSYLKAFDRAEESFQKLIVQTDKEIKNYLETGGAPYGLRIKKIGPRSFEARVSDKVRVVWVRRKNLISFAMVGNHEEVQNYLKSFER